MKKSPLDRYCNLISEYKKDPSDNASDAILLNGRKLIERIIKDTYGPGKNNTKELRKQLSPKVITWWRMINNFTHDDEIFNNMSVETFINKVAQLANEIDGKINLPKIELNIEPIEFRGKDDWYSNYHGVVKKIGKNNIGDFIEIEDIESMYERKNTHTVYYDSSLVFSVGQIYKMTLYKTGVFVSSKDIGVSVLRSEEETILHVENHFIQTTHPRFLEIINKNITMNETSMLDEIIKSNIIGDSDIVKELRVFFASLSLDQTISLLVPLKFSSPIPINSNRNMSPLKYEFWTKNPRKAYFSFFEKKIIAWFLEDRISDTFKYKDNLEAEIKYRDQYIWDLDGEIPDVFPDNNLFNHGYDDSKIIKYKDRFTNTRKHKLISVFDYWISNNVSYNVNPTISLDGLDRFQTDTFLSVIKNKFSLINGAAGSGKTKLSSKLMAEFDGKEKYIFIALTHKANSVVKEMETKLNIKTLTVAKFLNSDASYDDYNIIIDEVSMIGDVEWIEIAKMTSKVKRLILMGDCYQLPPIFSSSYIQYLFETYPEYFYKLEGNHRQKDKVDRDWVTEVRKGNVIVGSEKYFHLFDKYSDFIDFITAHSSDFDFVSPVHRGLYGTKAITAITSGSGDDSFARGDSVILNETIYGTNGYLHSDRKFTIQTISNKYIYFKERVTKKHIFQGVKEGFECNSAGMLTYNARYLQTDDSGNGVVHPFVKANAVSVHSMQGSTEDNICFVIPPGTKVSMKMFYTAVTRFKERLIILTDSNELDKILY